MQAAQEPSADVAALRRRAEDAEGQLADAHTRTKTLTKEFETEYVGLRREANAARREKDEADQRAAEAERRADARIEQAAAANKATIDGYQKRAAPATDDLDKSTERVPMLRAGTRTTPINRLAAAHATGAGPTARMQGATISPGAARTTPALAKPGSPVSPGAATSSPGHGRLYGTTGTTGRAQIPAGTSRLGATPSSIRPAGTGAATTPTRLSPGAGADNPTASGRRFQFPTDRT